MQITSYSLGTRLLPFQGILHATKCNKVALNRLHSSTRRKMGYRMRQELMHNDGEERHETIGDRTKQHLPQSGHHALLCPRVNSI
jgi:hypothetical protein